MPQATSRRRMKSSNAGLCREAAKRTRAAETCEAEMVRALVFAPSVAIGGVPEKSAGLFGAKASGDVWGERPDKLSERSDIVKSCGYIGAISNGGAQKVKAPALLKAKKGKSVVKTAPDLREKNHSPNTVK